VAIALTKDIQRWGEALGIVPEDVAFLLFAEVIGFNDVAQAGRQV
jgi:hypothetical protein